MTNSCVLLIEPDLGYRVLISRSLEEKGWKVKPVLKSSEMIKLAEKANMMIVSIGHPGIEDEWINAINVLEKSGHSIPVVFISDLSENDCGVKLRKCAAKFKWLRKPFEASTLDECLNSLLTSKNEDNSHKAAEESISEVRNGS